MMSKNDQQLPENNIVGLIPAAGSASRISPIPCSKEIFPIGFTDGETEGKYRPKAVLSYLLENMKAAGIAKAYMIIRDSKWDIPAYFSKQGHIGIDIAYLVTGITPSVCHTIDYAYPFIKDKIVVLGFPDVIFQPENAYRQLLTKYQKTKADIVLGLYVADNSRKVDMVAVGDHGEVVDIQIKPQKTDLKFMWVLAVWDSVFSSFIHAYLSEEFESSRAFRELHVGNIIRQAIKAGLNVQSVKFTKGSYLDIGTPQDLKEALKLKLNKY